MKSFDYPIKTFGEVLKNLEEFSHTVIEEESHKVNKHYLFRIVKVGKEENWGLFVKGVYSVVRDLNERDLLFSILEPIKSFVDDKRMEKANFNISLSIQCITIRDVEVELSAKFRDHPFLGTECLRKDKIPSIPQGYYINSNAISTRQPFYENRLLGYKYAPNKNLLRKMDEVIKEMEQKEIETSTTLYNKEGSPHQLTYTSYLYNITLHKVEELFSPLFDTACEFLKGTPRDVVIIQDRGYHGRPMMLYPDGKYIPSDQYKEIEE